ncbi:MAG: response regulator [Deltaproteobacteria bacterium]|jgi:DNA-binding NtrC family response regulator|nr:response regulator [Deltaproteobacteria bacterium]
MKAKKINILLVDDNEKFLKSIAERTKLKGFNVFTASNGQQALDIAQKRRIHVAVVDQKMPDMGGLVVIAKLKELVPDINTILLTGHGDEKLKEASEGLNSAYFEKNDMGRFWAFLSNLPLGTINILLVDDNVKFLDTLAERIRLKGYEPYTALNGHEAIEITKTNKIHIAIIDQKMPDMEGLVVITKLKEIDADIKTVLLTGHGDEKLKEASEALNTSYFEKEDMGKFWRFVRKALSSLERSMAAVGMATGGDLNNAVDIESHKAKKK